MADKTKIQWTDASWQPVVGCTKVSAGCLNCYAEKMACRLQRMYDSDPYGKVKHLAKYLGVVKFDYQVGKYNQWNGKTYCDESALEKPLHWKKPRRIFVCSMGDLFHESVPFGFILDVWRTMVSCPQHTFQILTKRPKRMKQFEKEYLTPCPGWKFPNIWLGVTAENQEQYDKRWPIAAKIPAAKLFVSMEPLLSGIDFINGHDEIPDWVIVGAESGPRRRFCNHQWANDIVKQCKAAGVPCFVKQLQENDSGKNKIVSLPPGWPREYPKQKPQQRT